MFSQGIFRLSLCILVTAVALRAEEDYPAQVISFEAEDAVGFAPDRVHWRSNATPKERAQAVWLVKDGEVLRFPICLPTPIDVQVLSVRYSSDGWMKEAAVLIDSKEIGVFNTIDNSDHGNNWNSFNITYGPFEPTFLSEGMHFVDVQLKKSMDTDPWGIEIDQITLWFGAPFTRKELTCPAEKPQGI